MRIDIENHIMDIIHFLYATEPTDGTCEDCSDTFPLSDTQTSTKRQAVTTTRAQTLCKQDIFEKLKMFNATHKVTFKLPRCNYRFSLKDTDEFETEVLRQFCINMGRVVQFEMLAYPEDKDANENFVGLHYHAVVKTKNDGKFFTVAPRKYKSALTYYPKRYLEVSLPKDPFYYDIIDREKELTATHQYEEYILKNYEYSTRLVDTKQFQQVSPFQR
ncbi:hypothetical protein OAL97_03910 [Paracoccaceae bacterium]|nr:hypothetical protein [Paracoccaceae bacterium]